MQSIPSVMEGRSEESNSNNNSTHSLSVLGSVKMELSIIEELDLRFGSAKNKHQIVHALEHSSILHRIPLPTPNATTEQARKDFRRERVLLNEVPFIPDRIDVDRCNAFSMTLSLLLERMMRRPDIHNADLYPDSEAITDAVMQRACRTGAGADSFFMVQKLLCVEGTFVTQRTFLTDPPIRIDVFVADPVPETEPAHPASAKQHPHQQHAPGSQLRNLTGRSSGESAGIAIGRGSGSNGGGGAPVAPLETVQEQPSAASSECATPPSTPPVSRAGRKGLSQEKYHSHHSHHIGLPSPLKLSLRNIGLISKGGKHSDHHHDDDQQDAVSPVPPFPQIQNPEGQGEPGTGSAGWRLASPASMQRHGGSAGSLTSNPSGSSSSGAGGGSGEICARVQVMNSFAIYDVSAIEEITGVASEDPDPWLEVEAVVVDESNFKTDQHWRKLQLIVTCPATGKVYTSSPDASSASRVSGRLSGRMILQELTSWFTSFPSPHGHHHHHSSSHRTPPGSTMSAQAASHSAFTSESMLSKGEAPIPSRPPTSLTLLSSDSSGRNSKIPALDAGGLTPSSDSSASAHPGSAGTASQKEAAARGDQEAQHEKLHAAAVAALLEPSPSTQEFVLSPDHSPLEGEGIAAARHAAQTGDYLSCSDSVAGTDTWTGTDAGTDAGTTAGTDFLSATGSDAGTGTGTGTDSNSRGTSLPLPVRTLEDLDLLIPSLRLSGAQYAAEDDSDADEVPTDVPLPEAPA